MPNHISPSEKLPYSILARHRYSCPPIIPWHSGTLRTHAQLRALPGVADYGFRIFSTAGDTILVIDMVVFSDMALHSDMPVKVSWSDWGPQHVYYFPHNRYSHISVFGSKMAYALPQDRTPDPGQRLEGPSAEGYFYVHIWDFNKRVIARSESINDPDSPDFFICKPARKTDSGDIFSNHAYTATVCRTL
ncbi:hypothetical protein BDR03DRAFT_961951 [Suillus americanus]|nr:hypothetical protein BDR03DRAFT_961951 [Suillus americanus]